MSYALIDNATLSAVQRLLGRIIIKNPDTINGDIAAFENFVQAILFYDTLICIDDYKEKYAQQRAAEFDYIKFLSPEGFDFEPIKGLTKKQANAIRPEIRGGEFADADFKNLIDLLKLNIVCTWDMRSSVYYLTMKMLGQPDTPEYEKYSAISSSIFSELADAHETKGRFDHEVTLYGSDGGKIDASTYRKTDLGGTTRALDMFIASLNWIAYKSIFYSLSARYLQADTILHPIRHAFQIHWMSKTGAFGHDFTSKLLARLASGASESYAEVIDNGRPAPVKLGLPMFSAWLMQQTGHVSHIIPTAFEIRKNDSFVVLRELLREIRRAYDSGDIVAANKGIERWTADLAAAMTTTRKEFGVKTEAGIPSSPIIKVLNSTSNLFGLPSFPELDFAIAKPSFLKSKPERAFSNILKDVTRELVTIERLGGIRDGLGAEFVIDDREYVPPKTENPRFRHAASFWKRPM